jgi:hypothetical protein
MAKFKKDVCDFLRLPDIPKKKWDGKSAFDCGVAVAVSRTEDECYAVAKFNPETDKEPQITKVFGYDVLVSVKEVFVVPSYMNTDNAEKADVDDASKQRIKEIEEEAAAIENDGVAEETSAPANEYYFDNIHDDEEAKAFISAYNKKEKIRGKVPTSHEGLLMRLSVIYSEVNKKK